MLVDYHVHTNFSQDSTASMQSQCEAAIARGIKQIAFTEHEEYNAADPTAFFFDYPAYMAELERCRALFAGRLVIRAGIEVTEPHRYPSLARNAMAAAPWDVVIGSLHWLTPGINCYLPEFFEHLGDPKESLRRLFTETIALARDGDYDILAHIDYPTRYHREIQGVYDVREYEPILRAALREVVKRDKAIEINVNPLRAGRAEPNPPALVVRWFKEEGGKYLSVGSDSHVPNHTGLHIDRALEIARAAGFREVVTYERRVPALVPIGG